MIDTVLKNTLVPLVLRAGLAVIFIYHGLGKVNADTNWGSAWNPALPTYQQILVAWGELLGGAALAIGFLTRLAALGIIAIMAGAIATVHWEHGFGLKDMGYEYNFALIVMAAALVLLGGGVISVDRFLWGRRPRP
jgi:putative oxidoreductase